MIIFHDVLDFAFFASAQRVGGQKSGSCDHRGFVPVSSSVRVGASQRSGGRRRRKPPHGTRACPTQYAILLPSFDLSAGQAGGGTAALVFSEGALAGIFTERDYLKVIPIRTIKTE